MRVSLLLPELINKWIVWNGPTCDCFVVHNSQRSRKFQMEKCIWLRLLILISFGRDWVDFNILEAKTCLEVDCFCALPHALIWLIIIFTYYQLRQKKTYFHKIYLEWPHGVRNLAYLSPSLFYTISEFIKIDETSLRLICHFNLSWNYS